MKLIKYLKRLFYRYILGHTYTVGYDIASEDGDCMVVFRKNRKGEITIVEKD